MPTSRLPRALEIGLSALALCLGAVGCDDTPTPSPTSTSQGASSGAAPSKPEGAPPGDRPAAEGPKASGPQPSPGERKDLSAMCAAVAHDYVDGTLSDYFAGLKTQSEWGAALRRKADESTTPGRVLQAAAKARGFAAFASGTPDPCTPLFDELDDLE